MLTQSIVRRLFDYDPTTGWLTWRIKPKKGMHVGDRAGTQGTTERAVRIDGKRYGEARIIWLWMTGAMPIEIDHANVNPFDNSWSNLRDATRNENAYNRRNERTGKLKWAYQYGMRYKSKIVANSVEYYLGTFDTEQEAHDMAYAKAQQLHGQFVRNK